jgi:hypothetical protein
MDTETELQIKITLEKIEKIKLYADEFIEICKKSNTDGVNLFFGCVHIVKNQLDTELEILRNRLCELRGE